MLKTLLTLPSGKTPDLQVYISYSDDADKLAKIIETLHDTQLEAVQVEDVLGGWKIGLSSLQAQTGSTQTAKALSTQYRALSEELSIDIAFVDANPVPNLSQPGVLFMDMDSTLIQCECIDEVGDFMGIKGQIAAITKSAMEGNMDFAESLLARVKLLAGLDESVLKQVYNERIRLTEGAEQLIQTVQEAGWKVGLVSGGFTYYANLLAQRLHLDLVSANTLEIVDGKLTGRVLGKIVDAQTKKELLISHCNEWGIDLACSVALGDGANDLPMLSTAGVGIAFHAKPKVRGMAPYALSKGGLNQTLNLLTPLRKEA